MALAMRILDRALRDDFGFEHVLCVYSGRRGIHLWACDTRARMMPNEVRGAVADYLGPVLNPATGRLRLSKTLHPALKRAHDEELVPFFWGTMLPHEVSRSGEEKPSRGKPEWEGRGEGGGYAGRRG
jgi:DNA primase small subunit